MIVEKVEEAGYKSALKGLALNKKKNAKDMITVAEKLSPYDYGHNKFLESIYVWLEVSAPRYIWSEMDTYRISTKQSQSTMHTLIKDLTVDYVELRKLFECDVSEELIQRLVSLAKSDKLMELKSILPEGFIQKRMWCMSYKCLRNIYIQRMKHRLPHWQMFIEQTYKQVDHPELLPTPSFLSR